MTYLVMCSTLLVSVTTYHSQKCFIRNFNAFTSKQKPPIAGQLASAVLSKSLRASQPEPVCHNKGSKAKLQGVDTMNNNNSQ